MKRTASWVLAAVLAAPAAAQQSLLPVGGLPGPDPLLPRGAARLALRAGYGAVAGNGASLDGFLGGWAVEFAASEAWSLGAGVGAHALSGTTHIPGNGRSGVTSGGGEPGGFIARRFSAGAARGALYAGLSLPLQVQSYAVTVFALTPSGRVSLTPDTRTSFLLAAPVGAAWGRGAGAWEVSLDAGLLQVLAGRQWDTLAALGPLSPSKTRRVRPHPVGRASMSVKHGPTGLSLTADGAGRGRVNGHGGLWSAGLRLGWDYGLRPGS